MTGLPPRVLELAEQVAAAHGVEVLEARLTGGRRGRQLSVTLDADAPVDADVVEQVSKQLSRALDAEDPLPGSYVLEVTTPGLDRPLRSARDFRRQLGRQVRLTVAEDAEDRVRQVQGVVLAAEERAVTLEVDGAPVQVPLSGVRKGKVVLPW